MSRDKGGKKKKGDGNVKTQSDYQSGKKGGKNNDSAINAFNPKPTGDKKK